MDKTWQKSRRIWLVRHGQTDYNLIPKTMRLSRAEYNQIVLRSDDSGLTPEGRIQIEKIVGRFTKRPLKAIHSSPLPRAVETADILAESLGIPVVRVNGFSEFIPTEADPLFLPGRERTLRNWFLHCMVRQFIPLFPVSETVWQARSRIKRAWRELMAWVPPDGDQNTPELLVSAHRGTILILLWAVRWDRRWKIVSSDTSNGGITEIKKR